MFMKVLVYIVCIKFICGFLNLSSYVTPVQIGSNKYTEYVCPSLHPPPPPVPSVPGVTYDIYLAGLPVVQGILLYGVPGTGKTMLAEAVAAESEVTVVRVSGAEIYSKFLGETEARLRQLFRTAEQQEPSIVLLDEV
jgi:DNA polymerase III delta prime subunit